MDNSVIYVDDNRMPQGRRWLMSCIGGRCTLYLSESILALPPEENAAVLEEAWQGFLGLRREVPSQRVPA